MTTVSQEEQRTIKPRYVAEMMEGFISQGGSPDQLLASLGFPPLNQLSNQLISVSEFNLITQAIEQALEDEMLGFFNTPAPFGSRSFINRTLTLLPNLQIATDTLNDFYALHNHGHYLFEPIDIDGQQGLQLNPQPGLQQGSSYFCQRMLLTSYKKLCWLAKTKIGLDRVEFAFPVDKSQTELQLVFGCSHIHQTQHCRLIFSETVFDKAVVQESDGAELFADKESFYTLLWPNLDTLEIKIRLMIGKDISQGFPKFDTIAEQLQISPQTLSRRLQEEGTSYQTIKDNIRRETAIALLTHSKLSVKEIAFTLGFQESSAFSKTFKNWFGMTASQYRQQSLVTD
ncbi:hypothetical protein R50073_36330 [Maricurvus nonylphenolicus]|uniref:AraC family transcriptional regulator n=1 Tax=Maricurvus nonylphenolicus TaxID=1008307 RepID=UPI0036F37682